MHDDRTPLKALRREIVAAVVMLAVVGAGALVVKSVIDLMMIK
jgi:hypothetical protein